MVVEELGKDDVNLAEIHKADPIAFGLRLAVTQEKHASADLAAEAFGIRALGENWREVSRSEANVVLVALLREDMAFSLRRLGDLQVRAAIDDFLGSFSPSARFFTNGNWEEGWTRSKHSSSSFGPAWTPATDATFDGGVIVIDSNLSGILWLEDED
jgi:hypothetical protein